MASASGNVNVEDTFGDEELVTISTREFNRRMKSQMLTEEEKTRWRKKRRCVKNRGKKVFIIDIAKF